jgi:hypothetical protein
VATRQDSSAGDFCLAGAAGYYGGSVRGKVRFSDCADAALWMAMPMARRTLAKLRGQGVEGLKVVSREGHAVHIASDH